MRKIIFITLFLLSQLIHSESNSIEIDLAKDEPNKGIIEIRTQLEKVDSLKISNWFSNEDYKIEIVLSETEIPPLSTAGDMSSSNPNIAKDQQTGGECNNLVDLLFQIDALQKDAATPANYGKWKEKQLPDLLEKLRLTLRIIEKNEINCDSKALAIKVQANSVHIHPVNLELKKDALLTIVITRRNLKWKYLISSYSTPRGKWYTSYGFSFISPLFRKSNNFFVKKDNANNSNEYIIAQKTDGSKKDWMDTDFVPSIFFWWMPTKGMSTPWRIGLTGGLGIDFKNPTVFAGIGFIYNYNIGINLGVAFHKQYRLKDKYDEGMIVKEMLEFDDLHKSVYSLNPFLSITFRFGSNPFASAKTDAPKTDEKTETDKK
ncbi:MAG: hypothetical protein NT166_27030 [Candidatus Aminicenantes bacterium]|nr:hypothetical protein [Candidatus Aminicenantes bacterium]